VYFWLVDPLFAGHPKEKDILTIPSGLLLCNWKCQPIRSTLSTDYISMCLSSILREFRRNCTIYADCGFLLFVSSKMGLSSARAHKKLEIMHGAAAGAGYVVALCVLCGDADVPRQTLIFSELFSSLVARKV
jgi:hypothetical protein